MKTSLSFALILAVVTFVSALRGTPAVAAAQASGTIFLVRHAERADGGAMAATKTTDPSLSDKGRQRAAALAVILRDAQIRTIFVTEYKRTQETAAPLAHSLGIVPTIIAANDTPALVARLKPLAGNALVVGHSNTLPEVISGLGIGGAVAIADDQYDDLFQVTSGTPRQLIRLRFLQ